MRDPTMGMGDFWQLSNMQVSSFGCHMYVNPEKDDAVTDIRQREPFNPREGTCKRGYES